MIFKLLSILQNKKVKYQNFDTPQKILILIFKFNQCFVWMWLSNRYFIIIVIFRMLENLSTELDKTESRLDIVSKKVAQVLQLSDGNLNNIILHEFIFFQMFNSL